MAAAREALVPGGTFIVWLYGHEGNNTYLSMILPLRRLTTKLPHRALVVLSNMLNLALDVYLWLCKRGLALPLRTYVTEVIGKFSRARRCLVIYDQLNPTYAKYYKEQEARALLENAGFRDVRLYHRHGYSWTVVGTK